MDDVFKKSIVILCPVYNESENVHIFYEEFKKVTLYLLNKYNVSFLFADNCSTDDTFYKLNNMSLEHDDIHVIRYSKNNGVMKSIYTGIIHAECDAIAVFDCDLQDPPSLLLNFVEAWEKDAKVVYGVRAKRDESFLLGLSRRLFRKLELFFSGTMVSIESGAWFLDKNVIYELRRRGKFEPYLAGMISRLGFKSQGIRYDRQRRERGSTKFGFFSYFSYATDGLVSGTVIPLRIAIAFGFIFSMLSFISLIYILFAKFYFDAPFASGVAASIVITLFSFSINFLFLGILGEYVGRIYLDRERSEPAIIESTLGSCEILLL